MTTLELENCIVVFGLNGVLSRYNFDRFGTKALDEHTWLSRNMQEDMYRFTKKTSLFDDLINKKCPMQMYVLSTASSSFEQKHQLNFLEENYPNIREDNVIFVAKDEYKVDILQELRDIHNKHNRYGYESTTNRIVLIEDKPSILKQVEELRTSEIKCYLVSDFI